MEGRIIDLSMEIYHGAPNYAYDPKCAVIVHNTIESIGYNITQISMSTHQGTHLDAPYHFLDNGITVDEIPLERCIGKVFKVDLTYKRPKEPILVEDFLPYEDMIVKGCKIVYQTGWDKKFPDKSYFYDFPYISKELSDWFAYKEIALLGMDTPTPNATDWMYVHKSLLEKEIVIVEALANLEKLTKEEFLLFAAPIKIKGRDGAPIRAVAIE